MTAQSDPYVRVYYRIIDDPKFADVFDDKVTLGWWLALLLSADATHPAPANLPRRLPAKVLEKLVQARLVDLIGTDRYRMHGLAAEREQRTEVGKKGATARWSQSDRNANALPTHSERNPIAMHSEPNRTTPIQTAPLRNGLKPVVEETPFVTLTDDEKAARRQKDRDELMARTMERLGVKP